MDERKCRGKAFLFLVSFLYIIMRIIMENTFEMCVLIKNPVDIEILITGTILC